MTAILQISDGTTTIDLIKGAGEYGFHLDSWRPQIVGYKGGGTWQQSSLSTGRQLVDKQFTNYIDTFSLKANQLDQDTLIYELQEIRRLLEKASSYWTADWQNEPVYLVAKATDETNTRYALIYSAGIPEDEQPYAQPFLQPLCNSVMDNLTLVIEHGFWLGNIPGTGTCVPTGVIQAFCSPYYLGFSAATSEVNCGSDATLDNIPNVDSFEADGWVYTSTDIASIAYIIGKEHWYLAYDPSHGLVGFVEGGIPDGLSRSGLDEFVADDSWHHVLMHYNNATGFIYLAIDGVWVTSYTTQTPCGGYAGDSSDDLTIGNNVANTTPFSDYIGWIRVTYQIHTPGVAFTPEPRCALPPTNVNTIGQWIGAEASGATIDNQEGTATLDGTQTDCTFHCCSTNYGNTDGDTCDNKVYIASKRNDANITDIYINDGGVWSANLQGAALPFNLLPAVPLANDAVYFGINTAVPNSGPFCSVVFDIGTAQTGITDIRWEYWNGAVWTALLVQDNTATTDAFDTTGVNGVHFQQQTAWVENDPGMGVTGYWIRARVQVAAGATAPTQQNRNIYSVLWPYVEVDAAQIGGDISSLLQIKCNQEDGISRVDDVLIGTRLTSRGSAFTPYINFADEQNPSGISLAVVAALTSFTDDIYSPTGRAILYNPAGAPPDSGNAYIHLDSTIAAEYIGKYHAFVRYWTTGVAANEITLQVFGHFEATLPLSSSPFYTSSVFYVPIGGGIEPLIMDIGAISIEAPASSLDGVTFQFYMENSDGTPGDLYLHDFILIPTDEWAGRFVEPEYAGSSVGIEDTDYLLVDSVEYLKKDIVSFTAEKATDNYKLPYQTKSSAVCSVNANSQSRIYFLETRNTNDISVPNSSLRIQILKNQRYLSMRGSR